MNLESLPLDESLLTVSILVIVIILFLLFRNISRSSEKRIKTEQGAHVIQKDIELITKYNILSDRANYVSYKFPRKLEKYGVRFREGVTTYYTRRNVLERNKYCFEDFVSMNIDDYKNMCGMELLFGLKQDIKEDLLYMIKNDITLLYSTDDIIKFFKEEYYLSDEVLDLLRKDIVLANWRMAAKDYKEIVGTV